MGRACITLHHIMTYVPTYLHHITAHHMTSDIHAFRFGQLRANSRIPPRADSLRPCNACLSLAARGRRHERFVVHGPCLFPCAAVHGYVASNYMCIFPGSEFHRSVAYVTAQRTRHAQTRSPCFSVGSWLRGCVPAVPVLSL